MREPRAAGDAWPLARAARERPDQIALRWGSDRALSYRELEREALALAGGLARAGVRNGARLALLMHSAPEQVALIHAAIALGAPLILLNARLSARELSPLLADAQPALLICSDALEPVAARAAAPCGTALRRTGTLVRAAGEVAAAGALDPDRDLSILFTSGTSGVPKGVQLSVANQWASARACAERVGAADDDAWLACMPLYHVGGLSLVLRSALAGGALVLHERFDAKQVARELAAGRITQLSLVPTMLHRLLSHPSWSGAPALRALLLGGGPIPAGLLRRARAAGLPIAATYGLTEAASGVATGVPGDDPQRGVPALPGTELSIRSPDGEPLPPGAAGEIWVRGPQVMRGYLNRPEESARALAGGWLHTGDVGELSSRGWLRVLDRRSDLIVSGGENVYPSEVESALLEHPAVRECAVVGPSDAEWGQRVEAIVVPDRRGEREPLRDALASHCAERLAGFKCPRAFHWVDALPRTASGKIRRHALRQSLEARHPE